MELNRTLRRNLAVFWKEHGIDFALFWCLGLGVSLRGVRGGVLVTWVFRDFGWEGACLTSVVCWRLMMPEPEREEFVRSVVPDIKAHNVDEGLGL